MEKISQAEYARRRGVTRAAVNKAVKTGRISCEYKDGKPLIDPDTADMEWDRNTDPAQVRLLAPKQKDNQPRRSIPKNDSSSKLAVPAAASPDSIDYWEQRAKRERAEAGLKELELAKTKDGLVDRAGVALAAASIGRLLRDRIMGLPARISSELASMHDAWGIEKALEKALRAVLDDVAKVSADDLMKNGK